MPPRIGLPRTFLPWILVAPFLKVRSEEDFDIFLRRILGLLLLFRR
jgi:hypothetical protein